LKWEYACTGIVAFLDETAAFLFLLLVFGSASEVDDGLDVEVITQNGAVLEGGFVGTSGAVKEAFFEGTDYN
jgi:hypothetical protein